MKTVSMHEAKTHLSRFVKEIREGKEPEIIIAVGGAPAARLVPYSSSARRVLGMDRGLIEIADDFDAVDEEIADLFEGNVARKRAKR
ncbi:MAG: type II toxin-antitoxin system prevent-host-death family antitoxin [Candidatus Eremiobacter antarcticus]|nr:type II toxin-antitoxin system prevent-host-death family antitoxin [Candidatus Eremiobacteraeota bacterium]PZR62343.1 MAG: type II toxin-antitoxin system prevent-host-death family antitoxin [Candidatus Eremiobacter sp. RRmetagenome_bin22]